MLWFQIGKRLLAMLSDGMPRACPVEPYDGLSPGDRFPAEMPRACPVELHVRKATQPTTGQARGIAMSVRLGVETSPTNHGTSPWDWTRQRSRVASNSAPS